MSNYITGTSDKSKKTALVLCIFFGYLGFHHFYVGNIKKGLIYICTFGLCMFGWWIDILTILLGSFRDNVGAPLRE